MAVDGRYEYEPLDDVCSSIFMPASIISGYDNDKVATAYSFFAMHRGLNMRMWFSLNDMVEWAGRLPRRHKGGINERFAQAVRILEEEGYVSIEGDIGGASYAVATFNLDKVVDECDNRGSSFAVLWIDEIEKVLGFDELKQGRDSALRVFAYLRTRIFRRPNRYRPEDVGKKPEERRYDNPETYHCYYEDIADELGLTPKVVSDCVKALGKLGLIYAESLPRKKKDGRWVTSHTIFSNMYKREGRKLLAFGEEYYLTEVGNRKKKMGIGEKPKR